MHFFVSTLDLDPEILSLAKSSDFLVEISSGNFTPFVEDSRTTDPYKLRERV